MKSFRPYAIALALFFIWLTCQSCSSSCSRTKRYWRKTRCVQIENRKTINRTRRALEKKVEASQRQYVIVDNQIILLRNNL